MVTLTRLQLGLLAVPLVALLGVAGSRLAAIGASEGPTHPQPIEVVDEGGASATATRVVVHVTGAVRRPGLFTLGEGARVADALRRAGGVSPRADLEAVNLAAPVIDGQQIVVPRRSGSASRAGAAGSPRPSGPPHPVSLSTATVDELDGLPGVGPVTARKIVEWRAKHALRSVDDLDAIPGIGAARIEQLRALVTP